MKLNAAWFGCSVSRPRIYIIFIRKFLGLLLMKLIFLICVFDAPTFETQGCRCEGHHRQCWTGRTCKCSYIEASGAAGFHSARISEYSFCFFLKVASTEVCLTQGLNYCLKTNPTWQRISRNTWAALARSGNVLPALT